MTGLNIGTQRFELRAFLTVCIRGFFLFLLVLLLFESRTRAVQWKGIELLKSTRADVLKEFGPPKVDRADYSGYQFPNERVSFAYSQKRCEAGEPGWNVAAGTVTSIWIEPIKRVRPADLALDLSSYKKMRDTEVQYVYFLIDEKKGIKYTIDESADSITMIEYFPSADKHSLQCEPR